MSKFTPPISKPANFGVSSKEVTDLVEKMRSDLAASKPAPPSGGFAEAVHTPASAPAAPRARVR